MKRLCGIFLGNSKNSGLEVIKDDHNYIVEETKNGVPYYFKAFIDLQGRVTMDMATKSTTGERSSIRAAVEYKNMLQHFGSRVRSIRSEWQSHSDNFKAFALARAAGDSVEVAITKTPSGRFALENGFSRINIIRGNDEIVLIDFVKP